jgi:hypothetical protein
VAGGGRDHARRFAAPGLELMPERWSERACPSASEAASLAFPTIAPPIRAGIVMPDGPVP